MLAGEVANSRSAERLEKVTIKYNAGGTIKEKKFKATKVKIADFYGRKLLIDHR